MAHVRVRARHKMSRSIARGDRQSRSRAPTTEGWPPSAVPGDRPKRTCTYAAGGNEEETRERPGRRSESIEL